MNYAGWGSKRCRTDILSRVAQHCAEIARSVRKLLLLPMLKFDDPNWMPLAQACFRGRVMVPTILRSAIHRGSLIKKSLDRFYGQRFRQSLKIRLSLKAFFPRSDNYNIPPGIRGHVTHQEDLRCHFGFPKRSVRAFLNRVDMAR
ncbi:hypothetical protein CDAR_100711 [Caerostris darwini]|uniref:Uncharacterized protein n=1 Tax=Caerostris darwini TaxID=1538125 RepID=A0AAV4QV81_9ARAC|nr:hypothetical protein CDAR_100711 [Caerostris darwini]